MISYFTRFNIIKLTTHNVLNVSPTETIICSSSIRPVVCHSTEGTDHDKRRQRCFCSNIHLDRYPSTVKPYRSPCLLSLFSSRATVTCVHNYGHHIFYFDVCRHAILNVIYNLLLCNMSAILLPFATRYCV